MANERRCPMCGRPNPADAEVCQHCGARLTFVGGAEDEPFGTAWFEKPETEPQDRPPSTDDTAWLRGFFATEREDLDGGDVLGEAAREVQEAGLPESGELRARFAASEELSLEREPSSREPESDWLPPWAEEETPAEPAAAAGEPAAAEPEAPSRAPESDWLPPWAEEETPAEPAAASGEPAAAEPEAPPRAPESDWLPPWAEEETPAEPAAASGEPAAAEPEAPSRAPESDWLPPWAEEETSAEPAAAAGEAAAAEPQTADTGWLPPWLNAETASLGEDAQVPAEWAATPAAEETPAPPSLADAAVRMIPQTGELALSDEEIDHLLGETAAEMVDDTEEPLPEPGPEEAVASDAEPPPERAQVPEWLRQAAPVMEEPSAPSLVDEILEEAAAGGEEDAPEALVGISGVLPAVPDVARPRVRSRAPLTLRLTRRQEQRAQWLHELLQAEKQPRTLGAPWTTLRFGWLRGLVGVALAVVAALWLYVPWQARPAPAPHPAWQGAFAAVEHLPPQAPVLVVADASWATATEMRPVVQPVWQHLAQRQAQVIQLSTVPWGVGLFPGPSTATNWRDMGYVPGGGVFMAQLVRTLPYAMTGGAQPWPPDPALPAWAAVQGVDDVALVVVVTDSPEQVRLWAEQVGPYVDRADSGLVFVLSSQAGPWATPYVGLPGVRGAVIGVEAGLAYAGQLHLDTTTTATLAMRYRGVHLFAVLLMVVAGGGAYLLQRVAQRSRRRAPGAQA